jgi:hypothetical protein
MTAVCKTAHLHIESDLLVRRPKPLSEMGPDCVFATRLA